MENKNSNTNKYRAEWIKKHPKLNAKGTRDYNTRIRNSLIQILGGVCVRCGFSDIRALQVDHINGGGVKESKNSKGMANLRMLRKIIDGSKEYQLLCANCNWIKRHENNETSHKFNMEKDN